MDERLSSSHSIFVVFKSALSGEMWSPKCYRATLCFLWLMALASVLMALSDLIPYLGILEILEILMDHMAQK